MVTGEHLSFRVGGAFPLRFASKIFCERDRHFHGLVIVESRRKRPEDHQIKYISRGSARPGNGPPLSVPAGRRKAGSSFQRREFS